MMICNEGVWAMPTPLHVSLPEARGLVMISVIDI